MPGRLERALMGGQQEAKEPKESPLQRLKRALGLEKAKAEAMAPAAPEDVAPEAVEAAAPAVAEFTGNNFAKAREKALEILANDPQNAFAMRLLDRLDKIEDAKAMEEGRHPVLDTMENRAKRLDAAGGKKAGGMFDFIYKKRMERQNQLEGMEE